MSNTWNSLTPNELKIAKLISVAFLLVSLFVFIFISQVFGGVLLLVGIFFGSGPFLLGSKGAVKNMIYVMRSLELGYCEWSDAEIEGQIKAIQSCGYEWFEKNSKVAFRHTKTGLYLSIIGLNFFKPEDIKTFYDDVWSKEDPEKVKARDLVAEDLQKAVLSNASNDEVARIFEKLKNQKKIENP